MTPSERQLQMKAMVVEHDGYRQAIQALETFHMPVRGGVPATGSISVLTGESRTGKTFATKRYVNRFPHEEGETGLIMPALYVDMPMEGGGGTRAILENIASALGLPFSMRMTNPSLTAAITRSLLDRQVNPLIFDETDHAFKEKDRRLVGFCRGLFRKFLDLGTLSIDCVGLLTTYNLIREDAQLTGRGGLHYRILRPYNWDNHEERMAFRLLCDEFDKLLPFPSRSGLKQTQMAHALFWVSQGNIGRLKSLIEAAGAIAINDVDAVCIELQHFVEAYEYRKPPAVSSTESPIKRGSARSVFSTRPEMDVSLV